MSGRGMSFNDPFKQYDGQPAVHPTNIGHACGAFMRANYLSIIFLIVVVVMVFTMYDAWNDCPSDNVTVGKVITHYTCRNTGGCGADCPYMNLKDPRMAIIIHRNVVKAISDKLESAYSDTTQMIMQQIPKTSADKREGLKTSLSASMETLKLCRDNVFPLLTKVEDLVVGFSKQKNTTTDVYLAQNRAAAVEAAAVINLRIFSIANMKIDATVKDNRLNNLSPQQKISVSDFDKEYTKAFAAKTSVDEAYLKALSYNAPGPSSPIHYEKVVSAALSADTPYDTIVSVMARLITAAQDIDKLEQKTTAQYKIIYTLHRSVESFEGFNNSMPGKVANEEVSALIASDNYSSALIKTALEPEIVKNHHKFATERMAFDSGGGPHSVLDHDTDINPWVGLFGRSSYRKTNGTSADVSSEPLRSIPSDDPNNMMRERVPRLTLV